MQTYEELQNQFGPLYEEELKNESVYKQSAVDHLQITINKYKATGQASDTQIGRGLTTYRLGMLSEAYAEFIEKALAPKRGVKPTWTTTLQELDSTFNDRKALCDLLSFTVLTGVINAMSDKGAGSLLTNLGKAIAQTVENEYKYQAFTQHLLTNEMSEERRIFEQGLSSRVSPHYRRHYMSVSMEKDHYSPKGLNHSEMTTLAIQLLVTAEPILEYYTIRNTGAKLMPQLVPTEKYINGWVKNEQHLLDNAYRMCPTVIPPMPWESYHVGGYYGDLAPHNKLLRLDSNKHGIFHKRYMKLLSQADLSQVLKALNGIQATAWTINKDVLEVMNEIVRRGGNLAGLPRFDEDPKPIILPENPTQDELAEYKAVMPSWYRADTRRKSLVLRALSHIKVANEFSKYEKIYFPCNMDFRGRIYPIPSFNFQGDDLNKSLILFADAPAFDSEEDARWLAITGCNISGRDKISFADRIDWVMRHEKDILLSAADPFAYTWWMTDVKITDDSTEAEKAYAKENNIDEPCQMLAFCFEWKKLHDWRTMHNGSCLGFVTGLASHQDGTCSGLQHYSAIFRDPVGGTAVNLVPQDKPNDIYSLVALEVNKILQHDAQHGTPDEASEDGKIKYGTKSMAQLWIAYGASEGVTGGINRKVTKRSTMTLAYGSKEYGMRDQVIEDIIDPAINRKGDKCVFNKHNKWRASSYMANLIWNSLDKVVIKACEGMKWLQTCSKKVTKKGKPVTWSTPLGLPIQQHYLDTEYKVVRMSVTGKRVRVYIPQQTGNVNKTKQTNGIAPNFIHSMDACSLQLTINYCLDAGIKHFSTIHDSFGCPMAQTKLMYKLVRKAFRDMYVDYDVLKSFKADMELLTTEKIPEPPQKGSLDLDCVMSSDYIFC